MKSYILLLITVCTSLLSCGTKAEKTTNVFADLPATANPYVIGKKVSDRFLSRPHSNTGTWYTEEQIKSGPLPNYPLQYLPYPDVCTWYGALKYAKLSDDKQVATRLYNRALPFLDKESHLIPPAVHVDYNVFGALMFELYNQTNDKRYLTIGKQMADAQFKTLSADEYEHLSDDVKRWYDMGLSWNTRLWIDDMYMITMIQAQAYHTTKERKYIDNAAKEMAFYLKQLQRENGLFYHADDAPIYWGRGNGWMAAGMTELLEYLPQDSEYREEILTGYRKMMTSLLSYQDKNGMWHQIIDDPQAWAETSGTGMFTYAFIMGVKNGWLDENTYAPAARKAWIALCSYINDDGDLTDICVGTNKKNDYQYYLDRERMVGDLHGHAPVLWCVNALLK